MSEHASEQSETPHAKVVAELIPELDKVVDDTGLTWDDATENLLKLGARVALSRQLESLRGALCLCRANLGHLAVSDVRRSCEEFLWLKYLATLEPELAHRIFFLMARLDGGNSIVALRAFVGDEVMVQKLDYVQPFLDGVAASLPKTLVALKEVSKGLGWPNSKYVVPSAKWIAEKVDELRLYEYLYSASSRAIHFSAGEAMRRGWSDSDGVLTVRPRDHQRFLSDFALYQLTDLFLKTFITVQPWVEGEVGNVEDGDSPGFDIEKLTAFGALPAVPIVLTSEYEIAQRPFRTRTTRRRGEETP